MEVPVASDPPEMPDTSEESAGPDDAPAASVDLAGLKTPLIVGGLLLIAAIGGTVVLTKIRRQTNRAGTSRT